MKIMEKETFRVPELMNDTRKIDFNSEVVEVQFENFDSEKVVKTINSHCVIRKHIGSSIVVPPIIEIGGKVLSLYWIIRNDLETFWNLKRGNPEKHKKIDLHNLTVSKIEISNDFKYIRLIYKYQSMVLCGMIGIIKPVYSKDSKIIENHYFAWGFSIGVG